MSLIPQANRADEFKTNGDMPKVAEGWRRVFPIFVTKTDTGLEVEIWWGRMLLSSLALLCLGWVTTAGGAYFFVKYYRGFKQAHYTDMLLLFVPSRWESFQVARGDDFIKAAQDELTKGKVREAFYDLQVGLGKAPGNREGRELLAQFYAAWHRPDRAQRVLLEGLEFHKDNDKYLQALFGFLLQQQQDQIVMSLAGRFLPAQPVINARNQLIAIADATAAFYRGNYDQAESRLTDYQLLGTQPGQLISIRIMWERGDQAGALARLHTIAQQLPQDSEIYALTVNWLRESGRDSDARRESMLRLITNPGNPTPRVDLLNSYKKDGNVTALNDAIESLFHDFAQDDRALLALADFAANTGDETLARRVYAHCKEDPEHRLNWEYPALMVVESLIVAKKYQSALDMADQLLAANPEWANRYAAVINGLRAIASYGKGDEAGGAIALASFITQPAVRAENLIAVSRRLKEIGSTIPARLVLAQAVKADPLNQSALTSLIKLDLQLNNVEPLAANLRSLLRMRKPSPEILQAAFDKVGGDLFLFYPDRMTLLQQVRSALDEAKARTRTAVLP